MLKMFVNEIAYSALISLLFYLVIYNASLYLVLIWWMGEGVNRSAFSVSILRGRGGLWESFLLLALFALAGVPPTGGFFAKMALVVALRGEVFFWLFGTLITILLLGIFFYLQNVRALLSLATPHPHCSTSVHAAPTCALLVSLLLVSGPILIDEALIVLFWVLF